MGINEQMANVGAEVGRAWARKSAGDADGFEEAIARMVELLDMAKSDPRWVRTGTLREICRVKEFVLEWLIGDNPYRFDAAGVDAYFGTFAATANLERSARRKESHRASGFAVS